MQAFSVFSLLSLVATLALTVCALDLESAKEQPCFPIAKTVSSDLQWVSSVKKWYYPLMSRYDLYQNVADLTKRDPKDITEDEVYYDSCITWTMEMDAFTVHGFKGKKSTYKIKPLSKTVDSFEFSMDGGNSGTCYNTLTDNKSFNFGACCMSDGQMVWGVASRTKSLSKEAEKQIYEHAESLGFKKEYFTRLRYDSCKTDKPNKKTEL